MPEARKIVARTLRLPVDLDGRLAEIAQEEGRSVNNLIQYILRRWLEQRAERSKDE